MSLRTKTILLVSVVLASIVVLLFIISRTILLRSYEDLEAQSTENSVQQAMNALQYDIQLLNIP